MDELDDKDWKIIRLALEDRIAKCAAGSMWAAHEAASQVRVKVAK